jgi:nucleoside-diphosphate-sugar epimerase
MSILLTGADGYIGWPTALRIASRTDERVVLVDTFERREWTEVVVLDSLTLALLGTSSIPVEQTNPKAISA